MFQFNIVHILGRLNGVADTLSRLFVIRGKSRKNEKRNVQQPEPLKCIESVHNIMVGHNGFNRTFHLLKEKGWHWKDMKRDIDRYIKNCGICQKLKASQGSVLASLSTTAEETLFSRISVDTIGPLPPDESHNAYIIVMICHFSRFVEIEPAPTCTQFDAAKALLKLIGRYGIPKEIQSDQGPQYVGNVVDELLKIFNIDRRFTLPYDPKANGVVERANQEVMKHLKSIVYAGGVKRNWSTYLPMVQRIINTSVHSAIGTSPARIVFGDKAYLDRGLNEPKIRMREENITTYEDYIQNLNTQLKAISEVSVEFQRKVLAKRMEKSPQNPTTFDVGELVLVSYPERPPDKLTSIWRGPMVVQRVESQTYYCQDLLSLAVVPFFISRLKKFYHTDRENKNIHALAARDKDERIVECITDHTGKPEQRKLMTFKVHWVGDEPGEESWEPWSVVRKLEALDKYIDQHAELSKLKHQVELKMQVRDRMGTEKRKRQSKK